MKTTLTSTLLTATISCLVFLAGCAPATDIVASWTSPEAVAATYDNVLVAAMTENMAAKRMIEAELAEELRAQGVSVSTSSELFPPNFTDEQVPGREEMLQTIRGNGHNAILTVAVIDEETETRYVPGSPYAPMNRFGYYTTFWGYFNYWQPQIYDPGYYTQDKIYFLETNLYDAETQDLVWSAQSETVNPTDLERFSEGFAKVTVNAMTEDNVLDAERASIK